MPLVNQGERVLRDISSVATSEAAYRRMRVSFDSDWVQISVGLRLQTFFDHDFVFVTDPSNNLLYASLGRRSVDPNWFNSVRTELQPVLDVMPSANIAPRACSPSSAAPRSSPRSRSRAARRRLPMWRPMLRSS